MVSHVLPLHKSYDPTPWIPRCSPTTTYLPTRCFLNPALRFKSSPLFCISVIRELGIRRLRLAHIRLRSPCLQWLTPYRLSWGQSLVTRRLTSTVVSDLVFLFFWPSNMCHHSESGSMTLATRLHGAILAFPLSTVFIGNGRTSQGLAYI